MEMCILKVMSVELNLRNEMIIRTWVSRRDLISSYGRVLTSSEAPLLV